MAGVRRLCGDVRPAVDPFPAPNKLNHACQKETNPV